MPSYSLYILKLHYKQKIDTGLLPKEYLKRT